MEDSTALHQGKISVKVLERCKRGVIRKINVPFSPWTTTEVEQLKSVLQELSSQMPHKVEITDADVEFVMERR